MVDSLECIDNVNTKPTWSFPKGPPLHLQWQTDAGSVSFDLELNEIAWRIVTQISGKAISLSNWLGLNHFL